MYVYNKEIFKRKFLKDNQTKEKHINILATEI